VTAPTLVGDPIPLALPLAHIEPHIAQAFGQTNGTIKSGPYMLLIQSMKLLAASQFATSRILM
jgi:hypothetical protein